MGKLQVLLIEDHLGERLNIMKVLRDLGAEVDSAITFQRAKDLASKKTYDFIISELILSHCPEMQGDGIQLWSALKKILPAAPFFLLADEAVRTMTQELLGDAESPPMLAKPVCHIELKKLIHVQLQGLKKISA